MAADGGASQVVYPRSEMLNGEKCETSFWRNKNHAHSNVQRIGSLNAAVAFNQLSDVFPMESI